MNRVHYIFQFCPHINNGLLTMLVGEHARYYRVDIIDSDTRRASRYHNEEEIRDLFNTDLTEFTMRLHYD